MHPFTVIDWSALVTVLAGVLAVHQHHARLARVLWYLAVALSGLSLLIGVTKLVVMFAWPGTFFAGGDTYPRADLAALRFGIAPALTRKIIDAVALLAFAVALRPAIAVGLARARRGPLLVASCAAGISALGSVLYIGAIFATPRFVFRSTYFDAELGQQLRGLWGPPWALGLAHACVIAITAVICARRSTPESTTPLSEPA